MAAASTDRNNQGPASCLEHVAACGQLEPGFKPQTLFIINLQPKPQLTDPCSLYIHRYRRNAPRVGFLKGCHPKCKLTCLHFLLEEQRHRTYVPFSSSVLLFRSLSSQTALYWSWTFEDRNSINWWGFRTVSREFTILIRLMLWHQKVDRRQQHVADNTVTTALLQNEVQLHFHCPLHRDEKREPHKQKIPQRFAAAAATAAASAVKAVKWV